MGSLAGNHALRKLARDGLSHRQIDIRSTGHAHCLIDIGPAGKRVTDCTSETCCRSTERLNLSRMVMSLVLELKEPFLRCKLTFIIHHVNVHIYAASIVLLTHLHIVKQTLSLEITGSYRCHIHQVQALMLTTQVLADLHVEVESTVNLALYEGILDGNLLKLGGESGVAAVVAPICVKDAELSLVRITSLLLEIVHHLTKVVGIHRQSHLPAIWCKFLLPKGGKSLKHLHRNDLRLFGLDEAGKVLFP